MRRERRGLDIAADDERAHRFELPHLRRLVLRVAVGAADVADQRQRAALTRAPRSARRPAPTRARGPDRRANRSRARRRTGSRRCSDRRPARAPPRRAATGRSSGAGARACSRRRRGRGTRGRHSGRRGCRTAWRLWPARWSCRQAARDEHELRLVAEGAAGEQRAHGLSASAPSGRRAVPRRRVAASGGVVEAFGAGSPRASATATSAACRNDVAANRPAAHALRSPRRENARPRACRQRPPHPRSGARSPPPAAWRSARSRACCGSAASAASPCSIVMPPISSFRSRPPVPSACEMPPPRLWMRQVTSCSPVPDAATRPMSPRRTTLAKPSGTPLTIAVPQSGPITSRSLARATVLIARSSLDRHVVGEQHHVQAERERLHRLGGGVVAGHRDQREVGVGCAARRRAPGWSAATRTPPRRRRRQSPLDCSIASAAAMASSHAAGSPRTTTSRSDGAPACRSTDRRPATAPGWPAWPSGRRPAAMPSRSRSLAPSCISVTESL